MRYVLLISLALSIATPGLAKLPPNQEQRVLDAAILAGADVTLTLEEFRKFPLPVEYCATYVTFPTGNPKVPELTVGHVGLDAKGPSRLVVTAPKGDRTEFERLATEVARWWTARPDSTIDDITEYRQVMRLAGAPDRRFTHTNLVSRIFEDYSRMGHRPVTVRQSCDDLPTWIARAHPVEFSLVFVRISSHLFL